MPDPKVQQYEQSLFKDYSHSSDCNYFKQHLLRILTVRHLVKLIYVELIVYLILFYTINGAYRFLFDDDQRREFDKVVEYFSANINYFGRDLTFLLGFYVSMVAKRWWDQYRLLPWPDDIAMGLTAYVVPNNVESEKLRKTIIRYALLSYVLCIRRFSANLKRHLPTVEKIVELVSNWWLPLAWSANMVKFGSTSNQIPADQKELMKAILNFRKGLESVESHVHVAIPLVYKVVVNTAIYSYFALTLISDQILERQDDKFDPYVPILTLFKLVTLIAWLKVAQAIEKPFDEDDSDFEMHALVKRHIRTTSIILNEFDKVPPLKNVTFDHTEIKSSPPSVESFEMYDSNAESPESSISMGSMSKEESKNQDQVPYHHKPKDSVVIDDLNPNGPWRITTAKMNQILPDNSLRPAQKSQDELDLKSAGSSSNNISIAS
eukprot:TCALIF_10419-PA protein Name:"Similar to Best1 Bestrophin-1 (Mus musculus)" AED:0.09 eAED:0.10 QI:23/0.4/0.5/1/0.6/0.33/6/66/434